MQRWRFLAPYVRMWLAACEVRDRDALHCAGDGLSMHRGLQFDAFCVHPPPRTAKALTRLRRAMRLVGLALLLDTNAWRLLRECADPLGDSFESDQYDATSLVPRIALVVYSRFPRHRRTPDPVQRARSVLLQQEEADDDDDDASSFRCTLEKILEQDTTGRIGRGLRVPIVVQLSPERPETAQQLQTYLHDVEMLLRDVQEEVSKSSSYPFRVEQIRLAVYPCFLDQVHHELHQLFSLGVPVLLRLRHDESNTLCSGSRLYLALARNPHAALNPRPAQEPLHTLVHREVYSSFTLWSSVAFASSLQTLLVDQEYLVDPIARLQHARWFAYALRMTRSLRSLVLTMYEPTEHEFEAMRELARASDPTRLLGCASTTTPISPSRRPSFVSLPADAPISTSQGSVSSLADLNVPCEWQFPVVCEDTTKSRVDFVVPGYGIYSVAASSVEIVQAGDAPDSCAGLTSLVVYSDEEWPGVASQFVDVFGRSLRVFSWAADETLLEDDCETFDTDLEEILALCPALESFTLKYRKLRSFTPLTRPVGNAPGCLKSLTLENVLVPLEELVKLFHALGDPMTLVARTLEELVYTNSTKPMGVDLAIAALEMLRTNRSLTVVHFSVEQDVSQRLASLFQAEQAVPVKVQMVSAREKLAFLSVVQSSKPLTLNDECVSLIFSFSTTMVERRISLSP